MIAWLLLGVAFLSSVLTGALRRYALARSIIDIPNARSSHSVPTPRGGGVAIVVSFLLAVPVLYFLGIIDWSATLALVGAGGGVAILGFADDHGHIAARWRLLGHFSAAIWALYWLNGLPALDMFGFVIDLGWIGNVLATLYLVWLLNLYNFMDGIDGIASIEAVSCCLGGAFLLWLTGHFQGVWPLGLLASAVLGFLFWNFPPAKIFMGDAGSGFLGMLLGVFSIQSSALDPAFLWVWLILLGVFIVDATLTLFQRLLRGVKVYEAHRSHAYQHATQRYGRHLPVTLAVALINLCWLLPLAMLVALHLLDGLVGVAIAYMPLVFLARRFGAGLELNSDLDTGSKI